MAFQPEPGTIHWKLHCSSTPHQVFAALSTNEGRAGFWAESAVEKDNFITFTILGYEPHHSRIIKCLPPTQFSVEYFGSIVDFTLTESNDGGTDLKLTATNIDESMHMC